MKLKHIIAIYCLCVTVAPGCKNGEEYQTKAALSLPERKDDEDSVLEKVQRTPVIAEAIEQSELVLDGAIISIDSTVHGHSKVPFYLVSIQAQKIWKGAAGEGQPLYFISHNIPSPDKRTGMIFFLKRIDSTNVFASGGRLKWQWTAGAPFVAGATAMPFLRAADSVAAAKRDTLKRDTVATEP